ncbi:MAG: DUF445 domain-containing protein [bacterium]|jgi:uncharacterized membrane protein YheB (UPF0754 family)
MQEVIFLFTVMPLVGALIGWVTNVLAIKLLFRPYRAWRIPLIGYQVQGLLPRRREEIARTIGAAIEEEILSSEILLERFLTPERKEEIAAAIVAAISEKVQAKLPPFIPPYLASLLVEYIRTETEKEAAAMVEGLTVRLTAAASEEIKIGRLVEEKLAELDLAGMERLVLRVAARELRHIEILGGVLGFIIGFGQASFVYFLNGRV